MTGHPVIETARLLLRAPDAGDFEWQRQWLNTPTVRRHLGGVSSPDELEAAFARNAAALAAGRPGYLTVVLRANGQVIGKCGLSPIDTAEAPSELDNAIQTGWTLAEPFWGRGYASEAARAVIGHAFRTRDLPAIWAQTSDSNVASTRVMARLGFRRCAYLDYVDSDYPPQDNPTTVYCIARDEWRG